MSLLNIDANAKTVKGQKLGYITGVMYLAPSDISGYNVCPYAKMAKCEEGCLNTAGRAAMAPGRAVFESNGHSLPDNTIHRARIARTIMFYEQRSEFFDLLVREIRGLIRKAERMNMIPVVRLNGTSDIPWEAYSVVTDGVLYQNIFAVFPEIQFYDYTKTFKRVEKKLAKNYHLTLSYSGANEKYSKAVLDMAKKYKINLAVVFRKGLPTKWFGRKVIDADESDLRFLDGRGVIAGLKAKGKAKKDTSGFVIDYA